MKWRLIVTPDVEPVLNMALDEALLGAVQPGRPTVRLYSWRPPAVSLGRFQRMCCLRQHVVAEQRQGIAPERAADLEGRGFLLVQRITGGGAIVHENDLTYSIVLAGLDELGLTYHAELYDFVHKVVARALRRLGVEAQKRAMGAKEGSEERLLGVVEKARSSIQAKRDASLSLSMTHSTGDVILSEAKNLAFSTGPVPPFFCSERTSPYDLVSAGRKMMGSAQRRRGEAILQHGSLPLEKSRMGEDVISVGEAAGRKVSFDEMAGLLRAELAATLRADPVPGEFTAEEWDLAHRIPQERIIRASRSRRVMR